MGFSLLQGFQIFTSVNMRVQQSGGNQRLETQVESRGDRLRRRQHIFSNQERKASLHHTAAAVSFTASHKVLIGRNERDNVKENRSQTKVAELAKKDSTSKMLAKKCASCKFCWSMHASTTMTTLLVVSLCQTTERRHFPYEFRENANRASRLNGCETLYGR